MKLDWRDYQRGEAYDELIDSQGVARPAAAALARDLEALDIRRLQRRQAAAERTIVEMGISFTVYSEGQNIDRAWPFDVIPGPSQPPNGTIRRPDCASDCRR